MSLPMFSHSRRSLYGNKFLNSNTRRYVTIWGNSALNDFYCALHFARVRYFSGAFIKRIYDAIIKRNAKNSHSIFAPSHGKGKNPYSAVILSFNHLQISQTIKLNGRKEVAREIFLIFSAGFSTVSLRFFCLLCFCWGLNDIIRFVNVCVKINEVKCEESVEI